MAVHGPSGQSGLESQTENTSAMASVKWSLLGTSLFDLSFDITRIASVERAFRR